MNSVMRAVDLAALLLAPLASGLLMSYGGSPFAGAVGVAVYCAAAYLPEVRTDRVHVSFSGVIDVVVTAALSAVPGPPVRAAAAPGRACVPGGRWPVCPVAGARQR
jgi:hypothetical protein